LKANEEIQIEEWGGRAVAEGQQIKRYARALQLVLLGGAEVIPLFQKDYEQEKQPSPARGGGWFTGPPMTALWSDGTITCCHPAAGQSRRGPGKGNVST